ncbi:bifunctional hydroxymethylpyrimidine kinase/phosphomethylpyrimidine kinase [Paucilactobacillus hokkaidonensis]|nr:bifunctional hydroxymethylpyrimidine kinase/phosphomethylpyrimidine kinase [Paucilactobacillus hokkaidonensis]KRO10361.1 phosphomethylpyrimidine kinase [Paucilactobacillus hokkaidonensis]
MVNEQVQALTIAGNDSDGSAGMPADLHAFFISNVYGMGLLTSAVSGNSYGIDAAHIVPLDFIKQQFKTLAADFKIRAAKTGMLANVEVMDTVAQCYQEVDFGPLVVDPVISTKHGAMLMEQAAYEEFKAKIIPLATVITPNFFEAQKLTESTLETTDDIVAGAAKLQKMGAKNVVIKGQHHTDDRETVDDYILLENGDHFWLKEPYIKTDRVNGTGDTFSAVIAAEIAKGNTVEAAIRTAKKVVHVSIANSIQVGHKFGPINHWAGQQA